MRATVLVSCLAAALAAGEGNAATSVGAQAFGGASIPIVQDDNDTGSIFGIRVPVSVHSMVTIEPYFASSALGSKDQEIGSFTYSREGFDVTAFGANVVLDWGNEGFRFFPYAGIGSHQLTRSGSEDINEAGYNFGLGFGFAPITKLSIDMRGEFNMVATGDTSRKFANIMLGVAYRIFPTQ